MSVRLVSEELYEVVNTVAEFAASDANVNPPRQGAPDRTDRTH